MPYITFFLAFLLFAWWRRQITKSYLEKLRRLEIQSLYDEISEKDEMIKKLTEENEFQARLIHKDNKLIPAMENAVVEFLNTDDLTSLEAVKLHGKELAAQLRAMTRDRKGTLDTFHSQNNILIPTGILGIDTMLAYMQKKAFANNIVLECKHSKEVLSQLTEKIPVEEISQLISDLLENAINAGLNRENGKIQVTFGKLQKELYISVADTGQPFEISTLHQFGINQHTTHEDTGGSGIGLMEIWSFKKKYRASIQIQEYAMHTKNFTKKITLSFNKRNHYVVQSHRYMDIINTQTRGDLYVIPAENNLVTGGSTNE